MSSGGKAVQDDGLRYELPERFGVKSRVYASFFAGTLAVDVDLTNTMENPLEVDMRALAGTNAAGVALRKRVDRGSHCGGELKGDVCALDRGQSCRWTAADPE